MMGFGLIFTVLIVIAFVYLLNERGQGRGNLFSSSPKGKSALDIAKERYARSEISKEEYDLLRRDLGS
jgi:putative membrane protein